ncbi:MAG: response regulator [Candidatus Omnitrophica bacterium]|nr:response regulator [Candidatus Omnitrophota bacterium]
MRVHRHAHTTEVDGVGVGVEGSGPPKRVLVIDNDPGIRRLVQRILEGQGYAVTACSDGAQAIALLKETPYRCVLLDVRMNGLQGTELLPIIKRNFPTLPVIIISAYCERQDASYYGSLGASDFLAKPFHDESLVEAVQRAVGATETIPLTLTSLSLAEARDQVYRTLLVTALRKTNWNQVKAAQLLGVSRYSLMRWLRKLQIQY